MKKSVLDSFSLIAYFEKEKDAEKVSHLIKSARNGEHLLYLSLINWGEVYYITRRSAGPDFADRVVHELKILPIEIEPVDEDMTRLAAELKSTRKMSYADCFAAALAKMRNAELVTGDKEFKEVEGLIKVHWL